MSRKIKKETVKRKKKNIKEIITKIEKNGKSMLIKVERKGRLTRPYYENATRMQSNLRFKISKGIVVDSHFRDIYWLELKLKLLTNCPSCGNPFVFGSKLKNNRANPHSPTLDRIYPKGGYTLTNTAIICYRCNSLKSDVVDGNELIKLGEWMNAQK